MLTETILINRIPELKRVHLFDQLDSTNDYAKQLLNDSEAPIPALIYTPDQTKGRGRGDNQWVSSAGSLTFSFILPLQLAEDRPNDSLIWGMAIACGLADLSDTQNGFQVKWPNDVLADGKKVAGILIETVAVQPAAQIVGIGVNLNNRPKANSDASLSAATSVVEVAQREFDPLDALESIWQQYRRILALTTGQLVKQYSSLDYLSDRRVRLNTSHGSQEGVCLGIDHVGALKLKVGHEERLITSGSNIELLD